MRILQLIQKPQYRGAERFASQLSNHLVAMGHEVIIVSLFEGVGELPFPGKVIHLKRPPSRRLFDPAGWKLLAEVVESFRPNVVQANAGDTLKFAVLSRVRHHWKAAIIFRNANKVSDFITSWPQRLFNKFLVHRLDHVISVSELCRQDFVATYGIPESKTTMVPIGVELDPVNAEVPADLTEWFAKGKVLVHVGSFVPEKNHWALIGLAKNLKKKGERFSLLMVGDGRLRPQIQDEVTRLGLSDQVLLTGHRSDVHSIVANAAVMVLPSIIEGLPGVILEAMFCRTPVVANDVGGISEVVKPGETGWLVKAGDEDAFLASVLEALHSDTSLIKERAWKLVTQHFNNEAIARRFLDVYQKIR